MAVTGPRQREWSTEGAALHPLFCSLGPRAPSTHQPCAKDLPLSLWCSLIPWRHSNEGNCFMVAFGTVHHWAPSNISIASSHVHLPWPWGPLSVSVPTFSPPSLRLQWAFPSQTANQESPLPTPFVSVWLPPRTFYSFLVTCLQPCLPPAPPPEKCQPPE